MRQLLLTLCLAPALAAPALGFDDWDGLHAAVLAIGDTNGDGASDFVVAHRPRAFGMGQAPSEVLPVVEQLPRIWCLSGKDGAVLWSRAGHERFGTRLARVGDLDGDGVGDLATAEDVPRDALVPAPKVQASPGERAAGREPVQPGPVPHPDAGRGRVLLLSGATGSVLGQLVPQDGPSRFGAGIAGGLQVTGDRTPDLVVGAHGRVWLIDGATLEPVRAYRLARDGRVHQAPVTGWDRPAAREGVTWMPGDKRSYSDFGNNLALLPDIDGDGLAEVAISGLRPSEAVVLQPPDEVRGGREAGEGSVHVLFSAGRLADLHLDSDGWVVVGGQDLDGDGVGDVITSGVDDHLRAWSVAKRELIWERRWDSGYMHAEGTSLALGGDLDGDGLSDLVLAANETAFDCDIGFAAVLSAATGETLLNARNGHSAATAAAVRPSMPGGLDADGLGDLDGDGKDEVAVMTPVFQEVRVLSGEQLDVLWARTFDELLAEVLPARGLPAGEGQPETAATD